MNKKSTWLKLSAMVITGGMLLGNGCWGYFWQGFFNTGWPADKRWLNVLIDVIKEDIFL
jgi:hypothetical protein